MALFLEYYCGYEKTAGGVHIHRRREYLELYLYEKPKSASERLHNKTVLAEAAKIRTVMEYELLNGKHGYSLGHSPGNFHDYFKSYLESYTKKDIATMRLSYSRFVDFLDERYPIFRNVIRAKDITPELICNFLDYLKGRSRGSGAHTIFARFKKVVKDAYRHDFFLKNPCDGISCGVNAGTLVKDVLSENEIVKLISTRWNGENIEIRRAFIFSLYTGIRFCDVVMLTYKNIDYGNTRIIFEQNKTKGRSNASMVDNPLNKNLLAILDSTLANTDTPVFRLPSHAQCNNYLKKWTAKAGIRKNITWHCARHTFGTFLQMKTGNINTVKKLLGHSSISHTQKYLRAADDLGRKAVAMLPKVSL